jgi:chorismate dehydratase
MPDHPFMNKYSISLISYLNSRPFLYGLENSSIRDEISISLDIPSITAEKMATGQVDIGLVPVGALISMKNYRIIGDFCIGAEGPVRTVVLAGCVPIEEIGTVLLDYQSKSSVLLTRILARYYWKKEFRWEESTPGFEKTAISGTTAGVVIGDRVFGIEKQYGRIVDLASEWNNFTGLPFVFAVWVSLHPIPPDFLDRFNQAVSFGIESVPEVEKLMQPFYPDVDIYDYFTRNINYVLDDRKRDGMHRFLHLAEQLDRGDEKLL